MISLVSVTLLAVLASPMQAASPADTAKAPAATAAKPISVLVETPAKASAETLAWAAELRTALAARKTEFRAAKPGEKPELVVQVESVAPAAQGAITMTGALVRADQTKPFNLTNNAPARQQAELLARNLRKLTDPMAAAPAAAPKKK